MKTFFYNLWNAPASTFAGAVVALSLWLSSTELGLPPSVSIGAAAVAIFVGAAYPKKNPK